MLMRFLTKPIVNSTKKILASTLVMKSFLPQLQSIRSNNGIKFLGKLIQKWFHEKGIIHQRSCIAPPLQNGIAERKHRQLLDDARAQRFQANLPPFWGVNAISLPLILSTNFQLSSLNINHHIKFYWKPFLHTSLFRYSDICVLLKI